MRTIYKNIVLAALAFSALACTKEDDFASSYLSDPNAVRITAQVGTNDVTGGFTRSNPLGTAEEQAKFNSGDAIAVTADGKDAVTYTFNGAAWTPASGKYLKWESNSMDFSAWYPAGKNNSSATTFTVPTEYTQDAPIADADYMVYTGVNYNTESNAISLEMERKMVRIVIIPTLNEQYANGYSIAGIKVHSNTSGYSNGEPVQENIEVESYKEGDCYYALLAPTQADASGIFLTVKVTDTDGAETSLTVKGIPATVSEKSYEFTLTVGKEVASISNVTVKEWITGTITGGEAEKVKGYLPIGITFNDAIVSFLTGTSGLTTKIAFVADHAWIPGDDAVEIEKTGVYMVRKLNPGSSPLYTLEIRTAATEFVFNKDCSNMFKTAVNRDKPTGPLANVQTIDFANCNTSCVTDMSFMFDNSTVGQLDMSNFNTANVKYMEGMFSKCKNLETLVLTNFNTGNTENVSQMFEFCEGLESITFGNNFKTDKVKDMSYMFRLCKKMVSLDLTGFSFTGITTDLSEMFYQFGDVSGINAPIPIKVTLDGYNYLKEKDTDIGSCAQYVKPDGTPWESQAIPASGN